MSIFHYFEAGEEVTIVNNGEGRDGNAVVLGIVTHQIYNDPITGVGIRLNFDPSKHPCYWIVGEMEKIWDFGEHSLCVFPQHQLRKRYDKGESFDTLMDTLKINSMQTI